MTKLDILNKIELPIFKSYNLSERISFLFKFKEKNLISKNIVLKNSCKKHECFIIGNGPSLKFIDLSLIKDYDTFTTNFFHKSENNFVSTYHVMVDGGFYNQHFDYTLNAYKDITNKTNTKFIFKTYAYDKLKNENVNLDNAYFIHTKLMQYNKFLKLDMCEDMTACVNVVLAAIQCAIYMGYKKIYLIGCDFNQYASMKPTHFYAKEAKERTVPMGVDLRWSSMAHFHHYALSNYARENDIEILNATEGSLIDAYERVKFDDIIEGEV